MDNQEFSYGFLKVNGQTSEKTGEQPELDLDIDIFPPLAPGVGANLPQATGDRLGG